MEWYRFPLAYADRSFGCDAFFDVVFPTSSEGTQGKLPFFQCIFTPSDVPDLKMAGNIVWALRNTTEAAEYKSVGVI